MIATQPIASAPVAAAHVTAATTGMPSPLSLLLTGLGSWAALALIVGAFYG